MSKVSDQIYRAQKEPSKGKIKRSSKGNLNNVKIKEHMSPKKLKCLRTLIFEDFNVRSLQLLKATSFENFH